MGGRGGERGEVPGVASTLTISGGETDGLYVGYLQPGGRVGSWRSLPGQRGAQPEHGHLRHMEIVSEILRANGIKVVRRIQIGCVACSLWVFSSMLQLHCETVYSSLHFLTTLRRASYD